MRRTQEITDEEEAILREAAEIIKRINSTQGTSRHFQAEPSFQRQFGLPESPDRYNEEHHNPVTEYNVGAANTFDCSSYYHGDVRQALALGDHISSYQDWQSSWPFAYNNNQPTSQSTHTSQRDQGLPLSLTSYESQTRNQILDVPEDSSSQDTDSLRNGSTTFTPLTLPSETASPGDQPFLSETASIPEDLGRYQISPSLDEATPVADFVEDSMLWLGTFDVGGQNSIQRAIFGENGDYRDSVHRQHGRGATWNSAGNGAELAARVPTPLVSNLANPPLSDMLLEPTSKCGKIPGLADAATRDNMKMQSAYRRCAPALLADSKLDTVISYQVPDPDHASLDEIFPGSIQPKIDYKPPIKRKAAAKRQPYSMEKRLQTKQARYIGICIQCRHVRKPVSYGHFTIQILTSYAYNIRCSVWKTQKTPWVNVYVVKRKPLTCFAFLAFAIRLSKVFSSAPRQICLTARFL